MIEGEEGARFEMTGEAANAATTVIRMNRAETGESAEEKRVDFTFTSRRVEKL